MGIKLNIPKINGIIKNKYSIGLDIGRRYIKLVCLLSEPSGVSIHSFICCRMSDGIKSSSYFKELFSKYSFPENKVSISLSGRLSLVRNIWVPDMTTKEVKASIRFELDQYIPFPVEEVYYDSFVLEAGPLTRKEGQMRVVLVAANKKAVEGKLKYAKDAGFVPVVVDLDALAIYNAFDYAGDASLKKGTIGIIDIGANKTIINIITEGILVFVREIELGVDRIIDVISKGFSVSGEEAEKMILSNDERIDKIKTEIISRLGKEIWNSFEYYEGQDQRAVEKILLTGGGSLPDKIPDLIKDCTGLPAERWNPLASIRNNLDKDSKQNLEKIAPIMAVAGGLACREL